MREKLIEKKLREAVKNMGGLAIKFFSSSYTGLPDRIIFLKGGVTAFAEIKTTGKSASPRQKLVHEVLRDLGFKVEVIDDQLSLDNFLRWCGNVE